MRRDAKVALVVALLLVVAGALRLWGLERDSPPYDVLPDAAPWTDEGTVAYQTVRAVRSQASLAEATAGGGRPLHRVLLFGTFEALGVGRLQGRLLSIVLGFVGLLALARLGNSVWPKAGAVLTVALAATDFYFVIFDRLLLTEGPLVALMSLLALATIRVRSGWGALAVGGGLALLIAGFKAHALMLAPAIAILYAIRRRHLVVPFLLGLGLTLLAWRFFVIPVQSPNYVAYLGRRVTGDELGLAEPVQAILQVFLAGLPAHYLPYHIPLLLFAGVEALAFLLAPRRWLRQSPDIVLLALVWLCVGLGGASLFRYLPPRYFHVASPALLLLAVAGARRVWLNLAPALRPRRIAVPLLLAFAAFVLVQAVAPPLVYGSYLFPVTLSALPMILIVFLYLITARRLPRWVGPAVLVCLLAGHLLLQAWLYGAGVVSSRPRLARIARTLDNDLPPGAVITGRLAATLQLLAPLNGVPALDYISRADLDRLSESNPVWVVVLERDEFRVEHDLWSSLEREAVHPVDYSSDQQVLHVYRYIGASGGELAGGETSLLSSAPGN